MKFPYNTYSQLKEFIQNFLLFFKFPANFFKIYSCFLITFSNVAVTFKRFQNFLGTLINSPSFFTTFIKKVSKFLYNFKISIKIFLKLFLNFSDVCTKFSRNLANSSSQFLPNPSKIFTQIFFFNPI